MAYWKLVKNDNNTLCGECMDNPKWIHVKYEGSSPITIVCNNCRQGECDSCVEQSCNEHNNFNPLT